MKYLRLTGRSDDQSRWSRPTPRNRVSGTTRTPSPGSPRSSSSTSAPSCRRWPARSVPRTGFSLSDAKEAFRSSLADYVSDDEAGEPKPKESVKSEVDESSDESFPASDAPAHSSGGNGSGAPETGTTTPSGARPALEPRPGGASRTAPKFEVDHGAVVIAAITSCTNTSNPSVMIGAALLAKKAVEKGLSASRGSRPRWRPAPRSSPTTTSGPG